MNDALLIVLQRIVVSGKEFHFVTVGLTVIRSQSDAYVIEEVGKAKKSGKGCTNRTGRYLQNGLSRYAVSRL